jgi:uracil-DNA glycosylase
MPRPSGSPGRNCPRCPRLVAYRKSWRALESKWFNAPVDSFGPIDARLLIVGLAPGLRGANRTGRPFTGDYAGDLLYATLKEFGFAAGDYEARPDDGLRLIDCRITNAVRCVPPENKPTPQEIATCRDFLKSTIAEMKKLTAIVTLGRIAHDSTVRALSGKTSAAPFNHGGEAKLGDFTLFSSYHCSRYNTNTGKLTAQMFRAVFANVRRVLGTSS